jgi:hypothetical protein
VPLIDIDDAQELLSPVADALLVSPRRAAVQIWNQFEAANPDTAAAITSTTRAGMIHDFTVREVRRALLVDGISNVAPEIEALDFFAVAVGSEVLVRYKHVGGGLPQNVATDVRRRLALQRYDDETMQALAFDGIPDPPTLLTCGYTLDVDGGLGTVTVQCDYAKTTLWRYILWGETGEGFGNFQQLPIDPALSPDATVVRSAKEEKQRPDASSEE